MNTTGDHTRSQYPDRGWRYPRTGRKSTLNRFCALSPARKRRYVLRESARVHARYGATIPSDSGLNPRARRQASYESSQCIVSASIMSWAGRSVEGDREQTATRADVEGGDTTRATHMAIQVHVTSCAAPTNEIHQFNTFAVPAETCRKARHPKSSETSTATYGTPWPFSRPRIDGAWPRCERPYIALLAVKVNELAVEKMETRMRALTSEGRTGMPRRFMAAGSQRGAYARSASRQMS
jgi:hypothetical protein